MENPEPLKNKRIMRSQEFVYSEEDIKSAVEWLNEEDQITWNRFFTKKIDAVDLQTELAINKQKAFEDVKENG